MQRRDFLRTAALALSALPLAGLGALSPGAKLRRVDIHRLVKGRTVCYRNQSFSMIRVDDIIVVRSCPDDTVDGLLYHVLEKERRKNEDDGCGRWGLVVESLNGS